MMNVGSVRIAGQPSSKTVSEVLALMQLAGVGEKPVKKLMEKILETQKHNEQIVTEAHAAKKEAELAETKANATIAEAIRSRTALKEAAENFKSWKIDIEASVQVQVDNIYKREVTFKAQKAAFEMKMRTETGVLTQSRNDITKRIVAIEKRETACAEMKKDLHETLQEFIQIGERIAQATDQAKHIFDR